LETLRSDDHRSADERPILVLGAAGQLGQAMAARFAAEQPTVALTRRELDLGDAHAVRARVREIGPSAIVNCAGFNQVDQAETRIEEAMEANAFAVLTLARAATESRAALVHYSSDFVFDGTIDRPYTEQDQPAPQSVYAASKLLGEWFAAETPTHYVLRVESLFGGVSLRKSSLDRIIDVAARGGPVKAFVDRVVSPSYAWDVVDATRAIVERRLAAGTYHCVNTGAATWYELALEVQKQLGTDARIEPISTRDVQLPAARPQYCALSNAKLRAAGIAMPSWQEAIARELAARARATKNDERPTTH
jgi:dTDP-4-dehydrorhamnose reductase